MAQRGVRIPARVVLYQEDGASYARCLEFDLVGDGDTREAALEQLVEAIFLQLEATVEHRNLENLISPADAKYCQMWFLGEPVSLDASNARPLILELH